MNSREKKRNFNIGEMTDLKLCNIEILKSVGVDTLLNRVKIETELNTKILYLGRQKIFMILLLAILVFNMKT